MFQKIRSMPGVIKMAMFVTCFGFVVFVICGSVFIVKGRPFEEFVRVECTVRNGDFFMVDTYKAKVVYYVDGVKYENIVDSRSHPIKIIFDYNKKDPTDIIVSRQSYTIGMPIMGGIGAAACVGGILIFRKERRKLLTTSVQSVQQ